MKRVLVLAEGQTEERFIKDVLYPHFSNRGIIMIPTIATTKRVKRGFTFKGGITDYHKVENDIRRLLGDTDVVAVTTFIDYYGLPSDFPGMSSRPSGKPIIRATHVETEWKNRIGNYRFNPYLMVHEFEALLFSKPELIGTTLNDSVVGRSLEEIRSSFPSPEDINENPDTSPSRRIINLSPGYRKALHGPIIAGRIGLEVIRGQCAHFNAWLSWMESL